MQIPAIPADEKERLETLRSLKILDTLPEERFDRLTRLAQRLFNVPVVTISLIDEKRQWFKSKQGTDATETPREVSFCGHTINGRSAMIVPDTLQDERFSDNPMVVQNPKIRFYAGYPIEAKNRMKMGTLCLIDVKPREFQPLEIQLLKNLASLVEAELAKYGDSITIELFGQAEERFFIKVLRYVMEYCRGMKYSIGMLIVHAPDMVNADGKAVLTPQVMAEIAKIVTKSVRSSDIVNSLENDAFYVFLPKCDQKGIAPVIDRIEHNLEAFTSKIPGMQNYHFRYRDFIWNAGDSSTVDDLVTKGVNLLEEARTDDSASF